MSFYSHIRLFLCKFKKCYSFIKGAPSSYKYFKLTPYDDVDCDSEPYRQLKFALFSNNEDIRNIAVSGDYGSGKSSLINSFIKKERIDKSSICISLATFDLSENIKKADNSLVVEKKDNPDEKNVEKEIDGQNSGFTKLSASANNTDNVYQDSIFVSNKIEESILKQLLYSSTVRKLKKSRFARLSKQSFLSWYSRFLLIICLFLDLFAFICTTKLCDRFIIFLEKDFSIYDIFELFFLDNYLLFLIIAFAVFLTYSLLIKVINLKKFAFNSSSISIELEKKSSFDAYLDEIVYFFEVTKTRYVFLEDLDRFNNIKIFNRLRELNFIVNKSPFVRKRVCFIYAIRNEIFFDAEQRLKFFDFVISVMPYASQHSAYGYLLENKKQICSCSKFSNSHISMNNSNSSYIETTSSDFCFKFLFPFYKRYQDNVPSKYNLYAQLLNKIDDDFFLEIGSFIKDSRLISNVFNEFFVFCDMFFHNLNLNDLNKTLNDYDELFSRKLFSYALLKNLYPSEYRQFTYSEKSKIDIADVFIKKSTYISQIRELFLNKKNNFEQKICRDLKSLLESDDVNALRKVKENWLTSILGNNWYEFFSLNESISFDNGKNYLNLSSIFSYDFSPDSNWENNIVYFKSGYSYNSPYRSNYVVKNVENIIGLLSSIKNHQLSTIKSQIELLQNYLSKLDDSFLLKDLLELCDNSKKFHDNQINTKLIEVKLDIKNRVNNDFIFFLIRKGYLSEDYPHFLSHNSNITVSSSDQVFIRSMIMNEPLDSYLHLHNIHNILKQIPEDCFGHMSILNFELFDYLVLNEYKYNSKLQKIISSFDKFGEDGFHFLFKFCFSFKKVKIISEPLLQCLFINFIKYNPMYWYFCYKSFHIMCTEERNKNELDELLKFKFEFIECIFNYSFLQEDNNFYYHSLLNENNALTDVICNDPLFLKSVHLLDPKILSYILDIFNCKINNLPSYSEVDDRYHCFFDYLLENNKFSLNKNVLETLAVYLGNGNKDCSRSILSVFYYSRYNKAENSSFINYLSDNIEFIIKELFVNEENFYQEDKAIVCGFFLNKLLINDQDQDKNKLLSSFIKKDNFFVDDVSVFINDYIDSSCKQWESDVVELLVNNNRITALWKNAVYLKEYDTKRFSLYLENNFKALSLLDQGYFVNCNNSLAKLNLSVDAFKRLISYLYDPNDNISNEVIEDLPDSKLRELILYLNIHDDIKLLKTILGKAPDISCLFLQKNENIIIDNNSILYQIDISKEIITKFLLDHSVNSALKTAFINNLFSSHKKTVCLYKIIADNKFLSLDYALIEEVFSSLSEISTMRKFVYMYHDSMNLTFLINCLKSCKSSYFNSLVFVYEKKQTRTIKNNKNNLYLIKSLVNLGAIASYKISSDLKTIKCFPLTNSMSND